MYTVAQWGFGAMGSGITRVVLNRQDLDLLGVISNIPEHVGKDVGDVLNLDHKTGILISCNPEDVLKKKPDIIILSTGSFLTEIAPLLKKIAESGSNCITIAEEAAYPWRSHPELSKEIDTIARQNNVSVLGTGINPGFVLDTLILALTGVCSRVDRIFAKRINDLSPFGPTVMSTQGVGKTLEEFEAGLLSGEIVGHIGFQQSIAMIASGLGWDLDEIIEKREPIISHTYRKSKFAYVEPGQVAGCKHTGYGMKNGQVVIELVHPQQIRPEIESIETGDYIQIEGEPRICVTNKPEIPGGDATINITVNMISQVMAAKPGLLTMLNLPLPRCVASRIRGKE